MESDQRGNIPLIVALIDDIYNIMYQTRKQLITHTLIFETQEEASSSKIERGESKRDFVMLVDIPFTHR